MNKEQINVLPATVKNAGFILSMIKKLADYEKLSDWVIATEQNIVDTIFCERPYAYVLIGYYNDTPVGIALYFYNYSTFLAKPGIYLEDIFVLPEYRNKGVGKALFFKLAQIAKQNNCGRIDWCVLDWNTPSIEFYKSIGANILNDWKVCRLESKNIDKLIESIE